MGVVELNCEFVRVMRGERGNLGFLNLGFLNELIERSLNEARGTQMRF